MPTTTQSSGKGYNSDGIAYLSKRSKRDCQCGRASARQWRCHRIPKTAPTGSIDFPILNVAAWLRPAKDGKTVDAARIAMGGISSAPFLSTAAAGALIGRELTTDTINTAAHAARMESRPLDNTDLDFSWRRTMVEVWLRRTLEQAAHRLTRRRAGL